MNFCFASHLCALNILFSCYVALFGCVAIILYGKENENRNKKKQTMEGEIQVRALFSRLFCKYFLVIVLVVVNCDSFVDSIREGL